MLRWLIISTLIGYVLYKMGFFKSLTGGYTEKDRIRKPTGNVNFNTAPPKEKKRSTFKGGDYVDYEEIK